MQYMLWWRPIHKERILPLLLLPGCLHIWSKAGRKNAPPSRRHCKAPSDCRSFSRIVPLYKYVYKEIKRDKIILFFGFCCFLLQCLCFLNLMAFYIGSLRLVSLDCHMCSIGHIDGLNCYTYAYAPLHNKNIESKDMPASKT